MYLEEFKYHEDVTKPSRDFLQNLEKTMYKIVK